MRVSDSFFHTLEKVFLCILFGHLHTLFCSSFPPQLAPDKDFLLGLNYHILFSSADTTLRMVDHDDATNILAPQKASRAQPSS